MQLIRLPWHDRRLQRRLARLFGWPALLLVLVYLFDALMPQWSWTCRGERRGDGQFTQAPIPGWAWIADGYPRMLDPNPMDGCTFTPRNHLRALIERLG
jgi:hypothetical protein